MYVPEMHLILELRRVKEGGRVGKREREREEMQLKLELKMRLGIATAMANALAFPISWTNKQAADWKRERE